MRYARLAAAGTAVLVVLNLIAAPVPPSRAVSYRVFGRDENIYALEFSPDGKELIAAVEQPKGPDRLVAWDVAAGKVARQRRFQHDGQITSLRFSPSGKHLVVGQGNGRVSVCDPAGRPLSSVLISEELGADVKHASVAEEGGVFLNAVVGTNLAHRRDLATGKGRNFPIACVDGYRINGAAGTRDGSAFVCCTPEFVNLYPVGRFDAPRRLRAFDCLGGGTITAVAITADASAALACDVGDDRMALVDVKNDKLIRKWGGNGWPGVTVMAPFHGRNWFVTGTGNTGEIEILDAKGDRKALLRDKDAEYSVWALAVSRDDGLIAAKAMGRPVVVWDIRPLLKRP